jgi:hypothetical protein
MMQISAFFTGLWGLQSLFIASSRGPVGALPATADSRCSAGCTSQGDDNVVYMSPDASVACHIVSSSYQQLCVNLQDSSAVVDS